MQLPTATVAVLGLATSATGFTLPQAYSALHLGKRAECTPGYWRCLYGGILVCNGVGQWVPSYNCSQISACCSVSDGGLNAYCVKC
ncbi:hypothetical protein L209DRAFT_750467 [Thermothelomyces heterothallicus CBS 203.75]